MRGDQIAQVRQFNRLVTQRVGALDDHFLGRGRPLGASRLLYEIGERGADLRELRQRLGLDAGYVSRLAKALAKEGLIGVAPDDRDLGPPRGAFLVASIDGESVAGGCIKTTAPQVGSMKRMWVAEAARGLGIGRRMLEALEDRARGLGIATLRLETNKTLQEAIALYRSAGYRDVAPFNADPYATHWFEKRLGRTRTSRARARGTASA